MRNAASRTAKAVFRRLIGTATTFHSFRFIEGEVARSACAYVGESVYLDVALRWSCGEAAHVVRGRAVGPGHQAQVRLVRDRGGLQGVSGTLTTHLAAGEATQLVVDEFEVEHVEVMGDTVGLG